MFNEKAYITGLEITIENQEDQIAILEEELARTKALLDKVQAGITRSNIENRSETSWEP